MSSVLSRRNYWVYSLGLAVVWAVLLVIARAVGSAEKWNGRRSDREVDRAPVPVVES
jgi:hypothetical protein